MQQHFPRGTRVRPGGALVGRAALTVLLLGGLALAATPLTAAAVENPPAPIGTSPVTVSGQGPFAALQVTVSQTRNLINQVVEVSWRGGVPTQPDNGAFGVHYLNIMQCWGDGAAGPEREQCQYGALAGDNRAGAYVASRQTNYETLVDPAETYRPEPGSTENAYVPFRSVTGKTTNGARSEFFDQNTTNEVPFGRTRADGTGREFVEIQTVREAPGLGCGAPVESAGKTVGRSCWLVVVPRGDVEVDGSMRTTASTNQIESSALSATNWAQRIVVPLEFEPVGLPCKIGQAERRSVGNELVIEAMSRWQPALCGANRGAFNYSQVPDRVARRQLNDPDGGMVFVSRPLRADDPAPRGPVEYVPVALSGITVAFNIESQSTLDAPPEVRLQDASRVEELNLTPRLVAKLLTQSYRFAVDFTAESVKGNPLDLTRDPDFLEVNPTFKALSFPGIADILVTVSRSDIAEQVWEWIRADGDARAFLAGTPDQWGMRINPNYLKLDGALDGFPKSDPFCRVSTDERISVPLCTLDAHPYAADLLEAARAAGRGDTLVRTTFDPLGRPPGWKKSSPQPAGSRAVLALTDTASAARYGLGTARLRNGAGEFVRPNTQSLLVAAQAMVPTSPGSAVRQLPAGATARGAYPLAAPTYGASVPSLLTPAARAEYAELLRFAVGEGQRPGVAPGQLPEGFAPLPAALSAQALAAIERIIRPALPAASAPAPSVVAAPPAAPAVALPAPAPALAPVRAPAAPAPVVVVQAPVAPAPVALVPAPAVAAAPRVAVLATGTTAPTPAGAGRYAVAVMLALGGLAAGTGPVLLHGRSVVRGVTLTYSRTPAG